MLTRTKDTMKFERPWLPDWFLYWSEPADASGEETLRIVSWRRNLVLKGRSFDALVKRLLPRLDGETTVSALNLELADVFSPDEIAAALNMLGAQGIVVEGAADGAQNLPADRMPQLGWLSENAPDGTAAQARISQARIVLIGAGAQGAVTARALVAAGVSNLTLADPETVRPTDTYFSGLFASSDLGRNRADVLAGILKSQAQDCSIRVETLEHRSVEALGPVIADADLVLCCVDPGNMALILALNVACRIAAKPWIASSLESDEIVIGPGFFPAPNAPCYMCWRVREMATAQNPRTRYAIDAHLSQTAEDMSFRRENIAPSADIAGGMLAVEAMAWLVDPRASRLDGRFNVARLPSLQFEKHTVLRKPDCPVCGDAK